MHKGGDQDNDEGQDNQQSANTLLVTSIRSSMPERRHIMRQPKHLARHWAERLGKGVLQIPF